MRHTAHGYWLEEAGDAPPPAAALEGERRADVVVIGGGFTGMWAAWQLSELAPEANVVLLEAQTCGSGPSGRNGGFCDTLWFSLANMRSRWGADAALAVARASEQAVDRIGAFCEGQGVDAWFRRGGYLQVSTSPAQDDRWRDLFAVCRELGVEDAIQAQTAGEVARRCASPAFRGGAFCPSTATVQPARLARGLRAALIERGVELYEGSPVRGVRDGVGGVEVQTRSGLVKAGAAVIAVGGAARSRRGPLRNMLTVTSSHIVLTEPVPDLLEQVGWTGGECISDRRTMLHYFRTTPDGRIAFGLGGGRISYGARLRGRAEVDPEVAAAAEARLREYFPALGGRPVTHAWGGPIDASPTHLPIIVPLPGGHSYAAAGYTGNGVGPSHMVGRILASLALDRRDEHSRLPLVDPSPQHVPPEPFHWLGGTAIRRGIIAKEEAESRGERPRPADALLARLPALIGFHLGR